jgi:hypothetical protein
VGRIQVAQHYEEAFRDAHFVVALEKHSISSQVCSAFRARVIVTVR